METPNALNESLLPRRRFRWLKRIFGSMLVLIVGAAVSLSVWWYIVTSASDRELRKTIAEVNEIEPVLAIADLDARRPSIAYQENSALKISVAAKLLPAGIADSVLVNKTRAVPPDRPLDEALRIALEADLQKGKAGLDVLLNLENMPRGRYPVRWESDPMASDLAAHLMPARKAATLLCWEASLRAQRNDGDGAVVACRAALNAGRSIGDEPTLIAQLVRIACQIAALDAVERVIAQSSPAEDSLSQAQQLLIAEADHPLFTIALLGERALAHTIYLRLESGEMPLSELTSDSDPSIRDEFNGSFKFLDRARVKLSHASMLRNTTQMLSIARCPAHEWKAAVQQLMAANSQAPALAASHLTAMARIPDACGRSQALLRSAITALAVERFRLATGRWPNTLRELTPAYLPEVPLDPYNGEPLQLRRLADGVVVYSVGPDGEDNGGKLDRQNRSAPGTDVGFQLWDADKRGKPPADVKQKP